MRIEFSFFPACREPKGSTRNARAKLVVYAKTLSTSRITRAPDVFEDFLHSPISWILWIACPKLAFCRERSDGDDGASDIPAEDPIPRNHTSTIEQLDPALIALP
jgi:hypothetical protein